MKDHAKLDPNYISMDKNSEQFIERRVETNRQMRMKPVIMKLYMYLGMTCVHCHLYSKDIIVGVQVSSYITWQIET